MNKKLLTWLVGTVVVLVIVVGLGPIFVAKVVKHIVKKPGQQISAPVNIKAGGTITSVDKYIVLTTPNGVNNYILTGSRINELTKYASKKETVFVFGKLMKADPQNVNNVAIRARIDVADFSQNDFQVGTKLSQQVSDAIKSKIMEKVAFRDEILNKLKISTKYEVIKGSIFFDSYKNKTTNQINSVLAIEDKYKDVYILIGEGIFPIIENPAKYKNATIIAIGNTTNPLSNVPVKENVITFSVKEAYLEDMSKIEKEVK